MGGINLEKRQFLQIAPTFVGSTLRTIADQLLCAPEDIFSRLKLNNIEVEFDGKTFEGHITSIKIPEEPNNRKELCFGEGVKHISLSSLEYDELIKNYRRRHCHR